MKNYFYYDIFSLDEGLMDEWIGNHFWPISPEKTQQILNEILEINFKILEKEKDLFFRNCLITYNHHLNPYIIFFNYILLIEQIEKKKCVIKFSNHSNVMNYLYKKTKKFPLVPESFDYKRKSLRHIKDKIKTIFFNFKNFKFNFTKQFYAINNEGVLKNEYIKKINNWVEIVSLESLISSHGEFEEKIFKKFKKKIDSIHSRNIYYATKKLKIRIPDYVYTGILNYQYKSFKNIFCFLSNLSRNKKIKNCSKFFFDAPKTPIRAISCLVKDNGGKSVGFPHASWICPTLTKRPHYNEFLIFDEFVVYNKKQISLFNENLKKFSKKKINFISQDSDIFYKYKKKYDYKLPKKIKSVMILELQLWCDDVRFELPETMILYEFYFYLCIVLTSLGCKIYFKKRPKSKKLNNFNFFNKFKNVEIIDGDLQDPKIMGLANTIIFQYGLSSTLIPLICSNVKLIYIDCGWEKWNSEVLTVLKKRCDYVKASLDPKNRIRIKVKDLKKALTINEKNKNQEFFTKFLL